MVDRFRELEKPQGLRKKDVVLMATVTSFENVRHPRKSELRQFAELFAPLFQASSEDARRQAVAALSQNPNIPPTVALFIASQPIAVAAPFLASSPCLSDDLLIMIARTQGAAHARAIVRRQSLSPTVIDALVGLRHSMGPDRSDGDETVSQQARPDHSEALRERIKRLANHLNAAASDRLGVRTITSMQEALLVRFARNGEADHFCSTLSEVLSASRWLAERIMLDISGRQLAVTLAGVAMPSREAVFVLEHLYPHLRETADERTRAQALLKDLDPVECADRVEAWRRADSYTYRQGAAATTMSSSAGGAERIPADPAATRIKDPASGGVLPDRRHTAIVGDNHARKVLRARQR
ncbi:DUF2336 domain-containing protein [Ciceribacter sp. RN22]|nr:DUF2336 domain-containing protein [Ciceribacter sp. RN22]MCO6176875.1 DUF2336 domain-containing protein [Ciceribacter sp. RN22]